MTETKLELAPAVGLADIEWRVDGKPIQQGQNARCRFVPYIDAARAAQLLDEWVGPGNWSDNYESGAMEGKTVLWCYLSIKVGDEWVTKRDVGVASNFEAQKGMVSDAFKRAACLKWGVGRNVYELPTLWAPCRVDSNGKPWPSDGTLPELLRQLKDLGYEPSGRIQSSEPETVESGDTATGQPAAPSTEPSSSGAQQSMASVAGGSPEGESAELEPNGPSPTEQTESPGELVRQLREIVGSDRKKQNVATAHAMKLVTQSEGVKFAGSYSKIPELPEAILAELVSDLREKYEAEAA